MTRAQYLEFVESLLAESRGVDTTPSLIETNLELDAKLFFEDPTRERGCLLIADATYLAHADQSQHAPYHGGLIDLTRRKNTDYAGGADDPFTNFYAYGDVGVTVLQGILTRMVDKVCRLKGLFSGHLPLVSESIRDTLSDLILYAGLALAWQADDHFSPLKETTTSELKAPDLRDDLRTRYQEAKRNCLAAEQQYREACDLADKQRTLLFLKLEALMAASKALADGAMGR